MDCVKILAELSDGKLLQERSTLKEWTAEIALGSPDLTFAYNQIAAYLESKPPCKFAVSP
ncbi:unnamed protein product [Anisakis simplex]|uniref:Pentatricopeptide repeat-containing protein n=1 Tax=Anisakis simplex TaxID=6269 RepID=A0A0M3JG84_ANISI|nr:unnamed protein product [Anisakis simplex]